MRKVAFQGEPGAYSEQAAITKFGTLIETVPCKSIGDVFRLVEKNAADCGIVPLENSLEGSVNETYELLIRSKLGVCGEVKTRIEHCLLALPGTSLNDIETVYSHPQALAQCSGFLTRLNVETYPTYDTAGSAKMLNEKALRNAGAIASERAALIYGLEILQRNIEDTPENYTRFLVVGYDDPEPSGNDKTSVVFGTKHVSGSLHHALGELASRGINLVKIESRPTRTTPWEYHFFADFEGHKSDGKCAEALEGLKTATTFLRVLGSYPKAD